MPSYEMAKLVDHSGKGQIQSELCSLHRLTPLEPKLALAVAQKTTFFAGELRLFSSRASGWRIVCTHLQHIHRFAASMLQEGAPPTYVPVNDTPHYPTPVLLEGS